MIWPTDGLRLALTKIKTRRIRLAITLFIASLLFAALAAVLFTVAGVIASLEQYSKEGLGSRYIVSAGSQGAQNLFENPEVIKRAKEIEKEYLAKRKAEAKRLEIMYDTATEHPATSQFDGPTGKVEIVNGETRVGQQAIEEYLKIHPQPGLPELRAMAEPYQPQSLYKSLHISFTTAPPYIKVLEGGQEKFESNLTNTSFVFAHCEALARQNKGKQ